MSSPSLGWERLNDVYYRNRELYQFQQEIEEYSEIAAISQFSKTSAIYSQELIRIISGDGEVVSSINWNHHINGKIISLLWTLKEELVVVIANGLIRIYYDFENDFNEYGIGYDSALIGIKACKVVDEVIFILLNDFKIIYIDLSNEVIIPNIFKDLLKEELNDIEFYDWDIYKDSNDVLTILISLNNLIYQITKNDKITIKYSNGPISNINISSNKEFISLYNETENKILINSINFKLLLEYTQIESKPNQISWCASDAIILNFKDYLKLIAPGGSLNFYFTNEILSISNEIDGLTILTTSSLEFLNKLDSSTIECFKIGSISNSSILLDSVDKLMKHSPKANENLKIIGSYNDLIKAIEICLDASLEEFDSYWQKKLLKACSFGKSDVELRTNEAHISETFIQTCDDLRVLNDIRNNGIFLTFKQFKKIGIEFVIKLLIKRQKFFEAFQLAKFLDLPIDLIFISWACCKIKYNPNLNDEELSQKIITKFQSITNNGYISFDKISLVAFEEGRINLSKILINFESLFTKQIPILLKMEEIELALTKAMESQDIDLILKTLLILHSKLSLPSFFKLLNNSKISSQSFEYFNLNNDELIKDYYNQADRLLDISNLQIHQQFNEEDPSYDDDVNVLNSSIDTYSLMLKSSNELKQLQTQLKLTIYQVDLTNEFNVDFKRLSMVETLEKLLLLNQQSKITKFLKEFKINEKKFQNIKLNFFVSNSKFDELYEWVNNSNKKLSISYEVILKKLINLNQNKLALKILNKANFNYDLNLFYLIKLKEWKKIIANSVNKKDLEILKQLKNHQEIDQRLKDQIDQHISTLESSSSNGLTMFGL